jgi:hypothetical protein
MKPCAYFDWDEAAARDRLTVPVDDCSMQCGTCGFNPRIADKRVQKARREIRNKLNSQQSM